MRITELARDEKGVWRAVVRTGGALHKVDREYGSWRFTPVEGAETWQECPTVVAMDLQYRVRSLERSEVRARMAAQAREAGF